MLKSYYDGIEWYDYLIFLVYNCIFTYLLYSLGDVFFNIAKKSLRIFLLIFQLYFFIIITDSFFNFLPYIYDSQYYSYMISSGQYPQTNPENVIVLYYLSLFIGLISLNNPIIYIFINIAIYIIALFTFLKSWRTIFPNNYTAVEKIFPFLCLLFPAGLLYNTAPLSEAYILFGFALFFSGFLKFFYHKKWLPLITGSIILCAFRFQLLYFVLPVIFFLALYRLKTNYMVKSALFISGITLVFLIFRFIIVDEPFTAEKLAELRNTNLENAGQYVYGYASWHSYSDMVSDNIFYIAQFILSPLPIFITHNPASTPLPLLDLIFTFLLLAILVLNFKTIFIHFKPILLLALFYLILFGTSEYSLMDAIRHRMPIVILVMLMTAGPLENYFQRKKLQHNE
ncbi:MAG: hypothetical protein H7Y00_08425 [Fimbriimonadaceae bacterium]|nr:hypothetical protein [Chitinophagales bacterium]